MLIYEFTCPKCDHEWAKYLGKPIIPILPPLRRAEEKCPKCGKRVKPDGFHDY